MSGHSHWADINHKKAAGRHQTRQGVEQALQGDHRGRQAGGGDPDMNIRLRYAIDAAKAVSMPKENIARAVKSGTGELDGGDFEEVIYEGYGPGGVAILCEILTDNRNRTAGEIRKIFELADGKLGGTGCVAWMFDRKGLFIVAADKVDEDKLLELALEAGADDVKRVGDKFEITCDPERLPRRFRARWPRPGIEPDVERDRPHSHATPSISTPRRPPRCLKLMERLDDHDDVQSVVGELQHPRGRDGRDRRRLKLGSWPAIREDETMGMTHVTVTVRNSAAPDRAWEGLFLVDTGADRHRWCRGKLLREIGLVVQKRDGPPSWRMGRRMQLDVAGRRTGIHGGYRRDHRHLRSRRRGAHSRRNRARIGQHRGRSTAQRLKRLPATRLK